MDLRTKQTFDRKNQEAKQKRNEAAEKRRYITLEIFCMNYW